jgi:glycosyltransferase involved in cell wall biosynthesis
VPQHILVDLSTIRRRDAQTGVQRVVRAILAELRQRPPAGYAVRPVFAGRWRGFRDADNPRLFAPRVEAGPGDVFLAIDLAPRTLPRHAATLLRWKSAGARICFVVHDLLPALHPEWFTSSGVRAFGNWLDCLAACADDALATTRTGERALRELLEARYPGALSRLRTGWFHLGSDVEASTPSRGLPAGLDAVLGRLPAGLNVLMVGTIEPRKGHAQALNAFEKLWRRTEAANLVIVGRPGWGAAGLVRRLRQHPEAGRRLLWFDGASDELLRRLYAFCDGLLFASEAEGFGLPLVEISRYGKPVLARDIPVFRELAGEHVRYFAHDLESSLEGWLVELRAGHAPSSSGIAALTWRESAQRLLGALGIPGS